MIQTAVGPLAVRVRGDGPPAVLWHSLFVDERSWADVESQLSAQRRLILIAGPGHGASQDPGRPYTLGDCAVAANTVLEALDIDEAVDWVGNAWGGHVGIVFAARWPARCRTLVTLGSPIQALNVAQRARTLALLLAYRLLGRSRFIEAGVTNVLLSTRTRAQNPAAVHLVSDCLANADPAALRNAIVSISLRRPDLSSRLVEVAVPTLFVTGSDQEGWTPAQADSASRLLGPRFLRRCRRRRLPRAAGGPSRDGLAGLPVLGGASIDIRIGMMAGGVGPVGSHG